MSATFLVLLLAAADDPAPAAPAPEAAPAPAPEAPATDAKADASTKIVAVLDLKVEGDAAKALGNALATVIASDISSRPGYKAVSRNELKSLLAHQADASMLGCDSANCAANVAKLVDANLVVSGTLGEVVGGNGRALLLTLSLIDPSGPAVVQRVDVTWRGAPEEIVTAVKPTLDRLLLGTGAADFTGQLDLYAPDGTTVAVDGKEIGTAPLKGPHPSLAIGVHVVDVSGSGYVAARKDVVIAHNETTAVRITLDEEPYYTQWWFWTAVGGGAAVAIAAGTTVALATLQQPPPPATRILVKTNLPSVSAVSP